MNTSSQDPEPLRAGGAAAAEHLDQPVWRPFEDLPRAHAHPVIRGCLRAEPADFRVEEQLAFGPDDQGEHRLLLVRKTNCNTEWVARKIATRAGVPHKAVGYAGLKDRRAVTTQWFSVHLGPRPEPDWSSLCGHGIEVLESHAHKRKLRRGVLAGNAFDILLRDVSGDLEGLAQRVDRIAGAGVPNYFGPQRFGRAQGNLYRAEAMFLGAPAQDERGRRATRHLIGLYLSAARSQLFNEVLAERVQRDDWHSALPGERLQLLGSHSHFLAEDIDDTLRERVRSGDVQPTGPLLGAGTPLTTADAAALEAQVFDRYPHWCAGLAETGLKQERRPLVLYPEDLSLEWDAPDRCRLRFALPAGSYATAVLRELVVWTEPG